MVERPHPNRLQPATRDHGAYRQIGRRLGHGIFVERLKQKALVDRNALPRAPAVYLAGPTKIIAQFGSWAVIAFATFNAPKN